MKKIKELIEVILILYLIIVIIYCFARLNKKNVKVDNEFKKVELKVGKEEKVDSGSYLYINNYSIHLSDYLVDNGYKITNKDGVLRIKSNDKSYEAILIQLTDHYINPSEKEIDGFYESSEYKKLNDEDYDIDNDKEVEEHDKKESKLRVNYFKKLGYNEKNTPDYTLTDDEMDKIVGKFYKKDLQSIGTNYNNNDNYDYDIKAYNWGKVSTYRVLFNTKKKDENKFSGYFMIFEYFDNQLHSFGEVTLNTF